VIAADTPELPALIRFEDRLDLTGGPVYQVVNAGAKIAVEGGGLGAGRLEDALDLLLLLGGEVEAALEAGGHDAGAHPGDSARAAQLARVVEMRAEDAGSDAG
jgi:hypothetical protein